MLDKLLLSLSPYQKIRVHIVSWCRVVGLFVALLRVDNKHLNHLRLGQGNMVMISIDHVSKFLADKYNLHSV